MHRLKETTLARLRDRLRERGRRPSVGPTVANLPQSAVELMEINADYGALCEAMYLMMAADGRVLNVEREVLKGAMRTITDDSVRGVYIEAMLDTAAKRLAADGQEARLEVLIQALKSDPIKAEVAYVIAVAIAHADDELHDNEAAMLEQLSKGLSIEKSRVEAIMRELETESSES